MTEGGDEASAMRQVSCAQARNRLRSIVSIFKLVLCVEGVQVCVGGENSPP